MVAAGHVHNYERFYQDGIVYLVSGGGGAKPYTMVRTPADLYQSNEFPNYHYLKFVFEGNKLTATMIRVANPRGRRRGGKRKTISRFRLQNLRVDEKYIDRTTTLGW